MHDIPEFKIDQIARAFSLKTKIALHGSYPSALSLSDLASFSASHQSPIDSTLPLRYAPSLGSLCIRKRLAELYSTADIRLTEENVVITPGSIMANYLALATLCTKDDHVICQFPTYGQLYQLPEYFGARVQYWRMRPEKSWLPDIAELEQMVGPSTRAIILNNPSNPTGTVLPAEMLHDVKQLAQRFDITIISDEVFRPLFHDSTPSPPSVVSLGYRKVVATGSVSKAYSLPGIRVGWVISPDPEILHRITVARDYTTLNVSVVDDAIALYALGDDVLPKIIQRNLDICAININLLEGFVARNSVRCKWTRPSGAGTAFIHISDSHGRSVDDVAFADNLIETTGVSLLPGSLCFGETGTDDFKGFLRFNLGLDTGSLVKGLEMVELALQSL